ncbi:FMN reductase [Halolactibacillus miurensis]|uniref:FMN reductase n=1 Tax=Halolactibacillus miurensis TaxID=306541 RepID=A0A1I6V5I6_9BACI|nr:MULTISPECIES: NADPH-dependent FMN reductase [Halolactibacillus]GEM05854.1 FMN reductase [Halolactibacillus miurensis]SFT08953.1 FMN reductase [Halolactibacillus miurensis]
MHVVILSGSTVGSKTKTAMLAVEKVLQQRKDLTIELIDLKDYDLVFSDGRHYLDYTGDTKIVTEKLMQADILMIGTPIFQASIPGTLKNVFDLLPTKALEKKVVGLVVTAGSAKHYLVIEQQLKPILSYMKAVVSSNYVFIEEQDFHLKSIVNDDVHFRIQTLVEDTLLLKEAYDEMWKKKEDQYDF